MRKSIQLQISDPCHENWDNMTISQQGRFCAACQKEVIDFTTMSDRKVIETLDANPGSICGHAYNDQLNRSIKEPGSPMSTWKYVWTLLLTGFVFTKRAQAQGQVTISTSASKPAIETDKNALRKNVTLSKARTIFGQVVNNKHEPIPFASVILSKSGNGIKADSTGRFILKVKPGESADLEISAAGYEGKTFSIDHENPLIDAGIIQLEQKMMDEVVVTGYPPTQCRSITGTVTVISGAMTLVKKSRWEIVKRFAVDSLTVARIKVYPNPVQRTENITIYCNLKQTGRFGLLVFDASGRMVHNESISINNKQQQINFTPKLSTAGTYFIKLVGKENEVYQAKLLVR